MINDKQDHIVEANKMVSSIEYLGYELNTKLFYNISPELWEEVNQIFKQAKAMHKEEIENTYAEAYSAGYYRSLELVEWKIKNELKIDNNEQQ